MIALLARFWYLPVIAILVAFTGLQQMRIEHAHTKLSDYKLEVKENERIASELARQESERRQRIFDAEAEKVREEKQRLEVDVARLADVSDGLRGDLESFKKRAKNPQPAIGGKSEPGSDPIDLLAILYARADREAATLAEHADRLRQAGQACERAADKIASP